jgi:replication factor C small subunit
MALSEKYRPKKFEDIIGQDENIKVIRDILSNNKTENFLFYGPAGTGKTSTAFVIKNEMNYEFFDFNASDDRGIDFIRKSIKEITKMGSINGKQKVIFLDEADQLSRDAQPSLRRIMEDDSENNIFILSVNNPHNLIEPLVSRCVVLNFSKLTKESLMKILDKISLEEKIEIPDKIKEKLVKKSDGSARNLIKLLTQYSTGAKIKENNSDINIEDYLNEIRNGEYFKALHIIEYQKFKDIAEEVVKNLSNEDKLEEIIKIGDWVLPNPQPDDNIGKAALTAYLITRLKV